MVQQSRIPLIFCCYARKDKDLQEDLKAHLRSLQRQELIQIWHDGDISAGKAWNQEIKRYLNEAKIILLLISSDFIASDYCYDVEMKHALARHEQEETRVIPIILRPVTWDTIRIGNITLGNLQALPKEAKPVTLWRNRDEAWTDVTVGISRVVNEVQESLSTSQPEIQDQQQLVSRSFAQPFTQTPSLEQKQEALGKVKRLVPGVDFSFYQEIFGKPLFINRKSFFENPNDEKRKFIEYVFVDTYFYLDVIVDPEGKVLYFALTTRDQAFNPVFKNQAFQVTLGISKYSDIPGEARAAQGCYGANWFAYYETKYFGRQGAYQEFGFGFNTAGYSDTASSVRAYHGLLSTTHNCHGTLNKQEMEAVRKFSADEVFNTYAVSAPGIRITDYAHIILGVNSDQVRVLNT